MVAAAVENRFQKLYEENLTQFLKLEERHGVPPNIIAHAFSENKVCGDRVDFYLAETQPFILHYTSSGCSICRASASAIAHHSEGLRSRPLCRRFIKLVREVFAAHQSSNQGLQKSQESDEQSIVQQLTNLEGTPASLPPEQIRIFEALLSLRVYPTRETCILLGWECLEKILNDLDNL